MEKGKMLAEEELKNVTGGIKLFQSYDPPTTCQVCGAPMIKHPTILDYNGCLLYACTVNISDESHQLLWWKLKRQ